MINDNDGDSLYNKNGTSKGLYHYLFQFASFVFLVILIIYLQYPNSLSSYVEENLGGHMIIEHSIFFLFGYQIASILNLLRIRDTYFRIKQIITSRPNSSYADTKPETKKDKKRRYQWVFILIMLLIFWHVPVIFDIASYDNLIHLGQHLSFTFVGICIYKIIMKFDLSFILFLLLLSGGIMAAAGLFLALTNHSIYSYYTIQSHNDAGNYMIGTTILMTIILFPIALIRKAIQSIDNNNF